MAVAFSITKTNIVLHGTIIWSDAEDDKNILFLLIYVEIMYRRMTIASVTF